MKYQDYFNKKLLTAVLPLLSTNALNPEGWEYETHVCPCCGDETYTRKPGVGKDLEWPKGKSIRFHCP